MEAIKRQIFVLRDTLKDIIDYNIGTDMVPIEYHVMDFTVPATAAAVVYVLRPDGELDKILADVVENVISFQPTKGFFTEGLNAIRIRVVDNNKTLVSFTETVRAGKCMKFDDDAEAQQETLIEQLLTKMGESDGNMKIERAERIAGDENEKAERNKAIAAEQKEREKEIDVERQRINNLAKLQEGSTTGDAELTDIRTGADGKIYENAGEAVRGQVTALKEENNALNAKLFKNANDGNIDLSVVDFERGGINTKDGVDVSSDLYMRLKGYIAINNGVMQIIVKRPTAIVYIYRYNAKNNILIDSFDCRKNTELNLIKGYRYRIVVADEEMKVTEDNLEDCAEFIVTTQMTDLAEKVQYQETLMEDKNVKISILGTIMLLNGELKPHKRCGITDFIRTDGYDLIEFKTSLNNTGAGVAFYDINKEIILDLTISNDNDLLSVVSGTINLSDEQKYADVVYVRFCCYDETQKFPDDIFHVIMYKKHNLTRRIEKIETILNSNLLLKGITINCMGDSVTSTDYERPTWWEIIGENTGAKFNNYGQSGTTLAHTNDRHNWDFSFEIEDLPGYNPEDPKTWETGNCFVERVDEMDINADAVIVMGGTNDNNVPRGPWVNGGMETFFGALDTLIQRLLDTYKGKPIIFCTTIQSKNAWKENVPNPLEELMLKSDSDKLSLQLRAEAIKAKCRQYGVPCIDLYNKSGINGKDCGIYFRPEDNLHPSDIGQERIAKIVQNTLLIYLKGH